ncbi:MAG TPA: lytic transglycosylase domain-containing protein [Thermoanaerobaculia bacterium]|nr:lytic transglycosylase domain-containing protein [Thermoanaerobaculia bacterium]
MKHRLRFTVLCTLVFLATALRSTPSDTAVPDARTPIPARDEQETLRELAHWVASAPSRHTGVSLVTHQDLDAALAGKTRKHTLFPEGPDLEAQRRVLHDLPFGSAMSVAAERHEVDPLLVAAVVEAESGFRPRAVSPRGAVGLMQVLPSTGASLGARNLTDPHINLDAGSRYLRRLLREHKGDLELALAAYNAGPAAVQRYGGMPPFRETREYVGRVLRIYRKHQRSVDPFVPLVAGS